MSIGMVDSKDQLIAGLIALIPHKVAVLILLSTMTLEINQMSRFIHITVFSMALPSGIMLSLIVSKIEDGMVLCGFEALGCGAVFYVAIIEMLPNSLEGDWKILKGCSSVTSCLTTEICHFGYIEVGDGCWRKMCW